MPWVDCLRAVGYAPILAGLSAIAADSLGYSVSLSMDRAARTEAVLEAVVTTVTYAACVLTIVRVTSTDGLGAAVDMLPAFIQQPVRRLLRL